MTRFELYKKTVDVEGELYELLPLGGDYLPLVYRIISSLDAKGVNENDSRISEVISEELVKDIHTLLKQTFLQSYPDTEESLVDKFVGRHIWDLFPVLRT